MTGQIVFAGTIASTHTHRWVIYHMPNIDCLILRYLSKNVLTTQMNKGEQDEKDISHQLWFDIDESGLL